MKRFIVSVPFTGYVNVEVEAADKDGAIKAALTSPKLNFRDADEIRYHKHVVKGDVCSAVLEKADAEEVEQEEPVTEAEVIAFYDAHPDRAPFSLGGNPFEVMHGSKPTIRAALVRARELRTDRRGCAIADGEGHHCYSRQARSAEETFSLPVAEAAE